MACVGQHSAPYPLGVFNEIAATGPLIYSFWVYALVYCTFSLSDYFSEFGVLGEFVYVWFARRATAVSVQERLSLSAAPRTPGRNAHHGSRRASKRAPGTGGLCWAVAEII